MPLGIQIRQVKYLIKKLVRSMLGLKPFRTATSIISGIQAIHMAKNANYSMDKPVQNHV